MSSEFRVPSSERHGSHAEPEQTQEEGVSTQKPRDDEPLLQAIRVRQHAVPQTKLTAEC